MCFSMSRFRVVEVGGPIRDVAVETTTNPLQNLCRTASQSFRKKSTTEFAENFSVELDNHRNRGRTWAIRPRRPDSTVGKQQMCTCGARKRCQNLTSTMKHGVPNDVDDNETTCWTSPTSRRFLPKTSSFCVGMHRKLGCQTMWRRTGFRPDAASGHYQRHLDSVLDFAERQSQFYKLQALESRTIHGAPSKLAWCQDRRCSMRKLKVMLGCRSGSVTRRRPTACPKITTSIWWLNGTPTKMCSQLLKTWMRCPTR